MLAKVHAQTSPDSEAAGEAAVRWPEETGAQQRKTLSTEGGEMVRKTIGRSRGFKISFVSCRGRATTVLFGLQ